MAEAAATDALNWSKTHNPIFNGNRLKLGVFGLNGKCGANTLAPEAHRPEWKKIVPDHAALRDGGNLPAC